MYNLTSDNADVLCPNCRRVMVDLDDYGAAADTGILNTNVGGGWMSWQAEEVFWAIDIFNVLVAAVVDVFRKARVRRMCRRERAVYPRSLICPACLYLLRRK